MGTMFWGRVLYTMSIDYPKERERERESVKQTAKKTREVVIHKEDIGTEQSDFLVNWLQANI